MVVRPRGPSVAMASYMVALTMHQAEKAPLPYQASRPLLFMQAERAPLPYQASRPLPCMQIFDFDGALHYLRRFGCSYRIAPSVWRLIADPRQATRQSIRPVVVASRKSKVAGSK